MPGSAGVLSLSRQAQALPMPLARPPHQKLPKLPHLHTTPPHAYRHTPSGSNWASPAELLNSATASPKWLRQRASDSAALGCSSSA